MYSVQTPQSKSQLLQRVSDTLHMEVESLQSVRSCLYPVCGRVALPQSNMMLLLVKERKQNMSSRVHVTILNIFSCNDPRYTPFYAVVATLARLNRRTGCGPADDRFGLHPKYISDMNRTISIISEVNMYFPCVMPHLISMVQLINGSMWVQMLDAYFPDEVPMQKVCMPLLPCAHESHHLLPFPLLVWQVHCIFSTHA
jgi:hypothetical protein